MYQSTSLKAAPVVIKNGLIQNPDILRVGDMLLFAGTDSSRSYAGYVGHVEMVYSISGSTYTLCGHGSGTPSTKDMNTYCKTRYASKTSTKLGHKGLIKVVRAIQDDATDNPPAPASSVNTVKITGDSVNVRYGAGTSYAISTVAHKGNTFEQPDTSGWTCVVYAGRMRWVSSQYVDSAGVCTASYLNIRNGAGTQYESVASVESGYKFTLANCEGWLPIKHNDVICWVSSKYADASAPATLPRTVKIEGGNCYVRSAPNTSGRELGAVASGTALEYGGQTSIDGWHLVAYKNQNGWVSGKYGKLA